MKKPSFILTILGIFILLILLSFSPPKIINSSEELSNLPDNTKIQTTGKVISERQYQTTKLLKLDNDVEITCQNCPSYINRTLTLVGIIEKYQNKTQIKALRIVFP